MLEGAAITLLTILNYCLKSFIVLSFALLVGSLIRHKSASAQHAFWLISLIAAAAVPLLSVFIPRLNIHFGASRLVFDDPFWIHRTSASFSAGQPPGPLLLALIYVAGIAALAIWMSVGRAYALRIRRNACPADRTDCTRVVAEISTELGIHNDVDVLFSGRIASPLVTGILRPAIILPDTVRYWPETLLRSALAHELIHIKRRDLLSKAIAYYCCCLTWFNPLAWFIKRKMLGEQEFACDARAAETFAQPSEYAKNLLETATAHRYAMGGSVAGLDLTGDLVERMKEILKPQRERGSVRLKHLLATIFFVLVLLTPIASLNVIARRINTDAATAAILPSDNNGLKRISSARGIDPDRFRILQETEDSIYLAFKVRR